MEQFAARIEERTERSPAQIDKSLFTISGSIHYVAALLRQAQDFYKQNGLEISDHPEILATLYNVGKIEKRLRTTLLEKRSPRINYYGLFMLRHRDLIATITKGNFDVEIAGSETNEGNQRHLFL